MTEHQPFGGTGGGEGWRMEERGGGRARLGLFVGGWEASLPQPLPVDTHLQEGKSNSGQTPCYFVKL
ncbi:Arginine--tRNA ligase [Clarias magur]|uniref:Arginine--tRNA ligase n=1 Tax=Clarias magur TaxID=1594786 RepID=A0A8J4X8K8_CLAMG|nr:Arginine--tRNA ligase [Clarias magur]